MSGYLADGTRRLAVAARRAGFHLRSSARPLDPADALRDVPAEPTLLFLCYGNICRSPMAERYARRRLREQGRSGASVRSAGFFDAEGRSSPEHAVRAAASFDVDLSTHRSTAVDAAAIADADVVLLMDVLNYHLLARAHDVDGAYFLKPFSSDADGFEIRDPYDGDLEAFHRAYREVAGAVDGLVDGLSD
jgi:protein-tyrosine phosphatase